MLSKQLASDGDTDGLELGLAVGLVEGEPLGDPDGLAVGEMLGLEVGLCDGLDDGLPLGEMLGLDVGLCVGLIEGLPLGETEGATVLSQQLMNDAGKPAGGAGDGHALFAATLRSSSLLSGPLIVPVLALCRENG